MKSLACWLSAVLPVVLVCAACCGAGAQPPPAGGYYEEDVNRSNALRTEQARELDEYILKQKADASRLHALFRPDYSSSAAYTASTRQLKRAFCDSIGYPPPGAPDPGPPSFDKIGEDSIGNYYRVKISVLPGVHAEGIYIVPKSAKGRVPLVISMHGGGGSPEVALFHGGANYHDMVRGAVKRGCALRGRREVRRKVIAINLRVALQICDAACQSWWCRRDVWYKPHAW